MNRQDELKCGSAHRVSFSPNATTMIFNNGTAYRKSNAQPFLFGRDERLKQSLEYVIWNSSPVILNQKPDMVGVNDARSNKDIPAILVLGAVEIPMRFSGG